MESLLQRERDGLRTRWPRIIALLTCLATTLVIAQQGGTIAQQSSLIRVLWDDSKQLTQYRINELVKQREKVAEPSTPPPPAAEKKRPSQKATPEATPQPEVPPVQSVLPAKPGRILNRI